MEYKIINSKLFYMLLQIYTIRLTQTIDSMYASLKLLHNPSFDVCGRVQGCRFLGGVFAILTPGRSKLQLVDYQLVKCLTDKSQHLMTSSPLTTSSVQGNKNHSPPDRTWSHGK